MDFGNEIGKKKNIPVFSEYAKDLEGQVKEWYV